MKKCFSSYRSHVPKLSLLSLRSGNFTAVVGVCLVATANIAIAQQPGETASPDVTLKVTQRAEKFMKDIATLSPMPPKTDPVHAQAWPRLLDATLSVKEQAEAAAPVVKGHVYSSIRSGPAWMVSWNDRTGVTITINPRGAITTFSDDSLNRTLMAEPPLEEAEFISAQMAASRALRYLEATGINPNELVLRTVRFANGAYPAVAGSQAWYVDFDRVWQGVPYLQQGVFFRLDAGYGRLLNFGGAGFAAQPPAVGRLDVMPEQALAITRRFITPHVVEVTGDADVELRVVLPSHFWTSGERDDSPSTDKSRLAWSVRQPVTLEQGIERTLEVWVDTLTGEILGGDDVGLKGGGKMVVPGGAIGRTLRAAHSLQAVPLASPTAPTSGGQNNRKPLSLALSNNKLRFYGVVAGITGPSTSTQKLPASALTFKPTHRLTAALADGKTASYLYDAVSGRLAMQDSPAGETVQAGAGLRTWLSPVAAAAPKNKQATR